MTMGYYYMQLYNFFFEWFFDTIMTKWRLYLNYKNITIIINLVKNQALLLFILFLKRILLNNNNDDNQFI